MLLFHAILQIVFWMKMNFGKRRNDMFKIGNHLSSSKGYEAMGKMAVKLGANTFAFFTRNPRGGKAKEIESEGVKLFCSMQQNIRFRSWWLMHLIP